jgi:hypothetical protein
LREGSVMASRAVIFVVSSALAVAGLPVACEATSAGAFGVCLAKGYREISGFAARSGIAGPCRSLSEARRSR